ncbi:hypothetical protein V3N99_10740 [Dermatophilaceae bacterium Soc4.6]
MTLRNGERERGLARAAYQTFEPLHLLAYFGPHVDATREALGVGWLGSYVGMRAAPLGAVPAPVVAAAFFGFHPAAVAKAWALALDGRSPADLDAVRTACVDTGLRATLGDLVDSPEVARQAGRMREVISRADLGGRALAAAYAALPWPDAPHLALWQAATLFREWRGDGHNAALVARGLTPLDALVLYDAWLPPEQATGGRGRAFLQPSRKWSDDDWAARVEALTTEGLLEVDGDTVRASERGRALRDDIEDATDDASAAVWVDVLDAEELIAAFRPFSKAVISAGVLPGTTRRG